MTKKDLAPRQYESTPPQKREGLILLFTGHGKGKTTAGFGTVLRALGAGYKVAIVQFIKGKWVSGEIKALKKFGNQVEFMSAGEGFTWDTKSLKKDVAAARKGWKKCLALLRANRHDLYLFDELNYVLKYRFLSTDEVIKGIKEKAPEAHVILTGRDAPEKLLKVADIVTEMKEIKHPFGSGITAQPGVDF